MLLDLLMHPLIPQSFQLPCPLLGIHRGLAAPAALNSL